MFSPVRPSNWQTQIEQIVQHIAALPSAQLETFNSYIRTIDLRIEDNRNQEFLWEEKHTTVEQFTDWFMTARLWCEREEWKYLAEQLESRWMRIERFVGQDEWVSLAE